MNSFSFLLLQETERRPESRKLELNGYLTKPTTRLGRYPLLLEAILKCTPEDNPDKKTIPVVISIIKDFLQKVNLESGKCENAFNLRQINKGLTWKGEPMVCTAEVALLCPRNKMKIASHHLFVICFTCFRNSTYLQRTDSWS